MEKKLKAAINEILASPEISLTRREKRVLESILKHTIISRDTHKEFLDDRTFGEKLADQVAKFGGSWTFIMTFAAMLISWVILNSYILARSGETFDPYPYILLNLFLSMLAAIQAPIIMMSQNRQAAKDRLQATHDYEVNLKAELEIRLLHDKLDELRDKKWLELVEMQEKQIKCLEDLVESKNYPDKGKAPKNNQKYSELPAK
jgi:uncharacterized membrane protein